MKVLVVCTGNICRSPTGEGVLKQLAEKEKLPVEFDSAGTHDYHVGEAPDRRAITHAKKRGYGGAEHFEEALDLIEKAAKRLLDELRDLAVPRRS